MTPHPDFAAHGMPGTAALGPYRLTILARSDLAEDYAAVMQSADVLQGLFGPDWPVGLTEDEDALDLAWHEREFSARRSFAWVIRDEGGAYLGCAYLFPDMGKTGVGEGVFWFREMPDRRDHLAAFGPLFEAFVAAHAPDGFAVSYRDNAGLGRP